MKTGKEYWNLFHKETELLFQTRPSWMGNFDNDLPSAVFIRGLIEEYKPENILEIGTAAGWAAYYMLEEALKHKPNANITSIDFSEQIYYKPEKKIGAAFKEANPFLYEKWNKITNTTAIEFCSTTSQKFDFVFIDANHTHPWATLDFLSVLPKLTPNAIVVLHDVFLNEIVLGKMPADRHPKGIVCFKNIYKGPHIIYKTLIKDMVLSYDSIAPNCAAIQITNPKTIYKKLLCALNTPWEYNYITLEAIQDKIDLYKNYLTTFLDPKTAQKFTTIFLFQCKLAKLRKNIFNALNKVIQYFKEEKQLYQLKKRIKNKRVVFWGASIFLENIFRYHKINFPEIIGIIDINPNKHNQTLGKYKIFSPAELKQLNPDEIISTVINHKNINDAIKAELEKQNLSISVNSEFFK